MESNITMRSRISSEKAKRISFKSFFGIVCVYPNMRMESSCLFGYFVFFCEIFGWVGAICSVELPLFGEPAKYRQGFAVVWAKGKAENREQAKKALSLYAHGTFH